MPIEIRDLIVESESAAPTGATGPTRSGAEPGPAPMQPSASDAGRMLETLRRAATDRHDRRRAD